MIKRFKKYKQRHLFYRTNERIQAASLRVLDSSGKQIGILPKFEALEKARQLGLDLVEIAPKANPAVAKIIDFKKFLYQQEKKKREEKKKSKTSETKEIRLSPFIDDHDLNVMIKRAQAFLKNSNKVRLVVKFKGRQIVHPEFGHEVLNKVITAVSNISNVEKEAHLEGKQLIALVVPEKKKGETPIESEQNDDENKKIGQQKV